MSWSEVDGERILNEAEVSNLDLEFVQVNIDFLLYPSTRQNMSKHPFFHPAFTWMYVSLLTLGGTVLALIVWLVIAK